jgi:hypothetical protein
MNGVIAGLMGQGIITRVTSMSYDNNFKYAIQPWAWEYIIGHPELVDLTKDTR